MEMYEYLEERIAEWAGVQNVVACSSGTAALHLALEGIGLSPGASVVVPNYSMIAVPRAVHMAGLKPILVDCDASLNIDPTFLPGEGIVEGCRVQAIIVVHTYGRRADMEAIHRWVRSRANEGNVVYVIEDLAEAHGLAPHPETSAACWSFYQNKIVHGEEGGAVAFLDKRSGDYARALRCLGFTPAHDYTHIPRGLPYRMANGAASLILESLRSFEAFSGYLRVVEGWYDRELSNRGRALQPARHAPWVYDVRVPGMSGARLEALIDVLRSSGVAARHGFKPVSDQEEFRYCSITGMGNAMRASREVFYVPLRGTTEATVMKVVDIIDKML